MQGSTGNTDEISLYTLCDMESGMDPNVRSINILNQSHRDAMVSVLRISHMNIAIKMYFSRKFCAISCLNPTVILETPWQPKKLDIVTHMDIAIKMYLKKIFPPPMQILQLKCIVQVDSINLTLNLTIILHYAAISLLSISSSSLLQNLGVCLLEILICTFSFLRCVSMVTWGKFRCHSLHMRA